MHPHNLHYAHPFTTTQACQAPCTAAPQAATATGIGTVVAEAASGVGREAIMREEEEAARGAGSGVESVGTPLAAAAAVVAVVAGIERALHHDDVAMGWMGMVVLVVDALR